MIRDDELQAAVEAGIIDADARDRLVAFVNTRAPASPDAAPRPKFDVSHVLWYAGALIIITAMGLFSTAAFSALGGFALTATAVAYALGFVLLGLAEVARVGAAATALGPAVRGPLDLLAHPGRRLEGRLAQHAAAFAKGGYQRGPLRLGQRAVDGDPEQRSPRAVHLAADVQFGAVVIEEGAELKRGRHLFGAAAQRQQREELAPGQLERQQRRRRHGGVADGVSVARIAEQLCRRLRDVDLPAFADLHQHAGAHPPREVVVQDRQRDDAPHRRGDERPPDDQPAVLGQVLEAWAARRRRGGEQLDRADVRRRLARAHGRASRGGDGGAAAARRCGSAAARGSAIPWRSSCISGTIRWRSTSSWATGD